MLYEVITEGAHDLAWLALDKTGTVTTGKPALTDTVVLETAGDPVRIAVALAARSDHPVSRALVASYSGDLAMLPAVADFSALPGLV